MNSKSLEYNLCTGQRWMSKAEPELGLGILVSHDRRTMKIEFPGANCSRLYSIASAPVRRIKFGPEEKATTCGNKKFHITRVQEKQGLLTYIGEGIAVCETDLAPFMDLSLPQDRLLSGFAQTNTFFDLRKEIRFKHSLYQSSGVRGFLGGQVDLIPHQLYIAREVSRRYLPRVMLSDETGLGKTIEAGLILHRMLTLGTARRVLVIVPDALVHQWFIELYRKFNLNFRIFDQSHCAGALKEDPNTNPFLDDQQGIINYSTVRKDAHLQDLVLKAGWDMVVMDEAHHIFDTPEFYTFIQILGTRTRGLMLVSATPEQMGTTANFAQLRLLDPDRYFDENAWEEESKTWEKTAEKARTLLARGESVDRLLDTFGPGRVVFRNRRAVIKGFPDRKTFLLPLAGAADSFTGPDTDLCQDPRVICLAGLVKNLKPEKILVICASPEKAEAIDVALKTHMAVDTARFDETMGLLHRDRQAAWFAQAEGARLLICSEIGSEGRNFQFVHHLFLFDLPLNPELLEQRIGRLDRIGQKNTIQIHVPYIMGTDQEILARWYAEGLPLFRQNLNGIHSIFSRFEARLTGLINNARTKGDIDHYALDALINEADQYTRTVQERLDRGRHQLVALNSFKAEPARDLVNTIKKMDSESGLENLMERLLDHYGVDLNLVADKPCEKIYTLYQDRLADDSFPVLSQDTRAVTFDRATAVAREELTFLTWDHPFVSRVMDFFLTREAGCSAVACYDGSCPGGFRSGRHAQALFLETLYIPEIPGIENFPTAFEFIRSTPIHILLDHTGAQCHFTDKDFYDHLRTDQPGWFLEMDLVKTKVLPLLIDQSRTVAEEKACVMRDESVTALNKTLGNEIERLVSLKKVNPGITDSEIEAARAELEALTALLSGLRVRLDAVRLIRSKDFLTS